MWWDLRVLLIAVAVGAILATLIADRRPAVATALPPVAVPVVAAVAGVALAFSDAAPTGWTPLDVALRVGFGVAVPLAAARAGSLATSWLLVVAVATVVITEPPAAAVTGLAAGAFWSLAAAGVSRRESAAVAAAAAIGPMAFVDWPLATGLSAGAVAAATAPVVLVGLVRTDRAVRRPILLGSALAVLVLGVGAAVGLTAALSAKSDVDTATDLAVDGIDRIGDDDGVAQQRLREAAAHFDDAEAKLTAWWAKPALLVPAVAQQSRAVSTMASAGADLARTAADAADEADIDSIRPTDGTVDLSALADLSDPLQRSVASLRRASSRLDDIRSPLLLPPVADRLDTLEGEVDDALDSAELAADAVALAPQMLGADGPRHYFVAFDNPAESTADGGFMGNWAEVVADNGTIRLARSDRVRVLDDGGPDPEGRRIEGEPEYVSLYGQNPAHYWGAINFSPDHPTVSRIMAQLYPESGGTELDGVFSVTPGALAGFLELTGPVQVEGYPDRLTSANVRSILLHEQYLEFPKDQAGDREEFLSRAVKTLFDELTSGELPGPRAIATELGPAVAARDLQLWSAHEDEQALFRRLGATGDAVRRDADSFGVVTQNLNGNKIDWFLHRDVAYDLRWDPESGEVSGTLTADLRNDAPTTGLPHAVIGWGGDEELGQRPVADGENFMWVTLYSTFPIERVTVDGEEISFTAADELGHHTARFYLSVPSETTRRVAMDVRGVVDRGARYVLRPIRQTMVNPDEIEVQLHLVPGWRVAAVDGGSVTDDGKTALTREDATSPVEMRVDVDAEASRKGLLARLRGN